MKADRRHELKENVLAKDLGLASTFIKKHLNWIIGAVSAVIIITAVAYYAVSHAQANREQEWAKFYQLAAANSSETLDQRRDELLELAGSTSQKPLAAMAYLRAGNLNYNQLMLKLPSLDDAARQEQIQAIRSAYEKVISQYGEQVEPVAYAHIGLGLLAETQRQMDQAKKEYQAAVALGSKGAVLAAKEANQHLSKLEALAQPIVMAPGKPPASATQPAEMPAPAGELPPIVPDAAPGQP